MAELEERVTAPTRLDIAEATPRGRIPYIAARQAVDYAVKTETNLGSSSGEAVSRVRSAFAALNEAMLRGVLEPPIEPESNLGGVITDFNVFYHGINGKRRASSTEVSTSIEGLYLVIDHGSRSAPAPVSAVEQFDALAYERVHSDPKFEGRMKAARARRVAWKRNRSDG